MTRTPLRIATTKQLERAVREAGFEAVLLPEPSPLDIHGSIEKRVADGKVHHAFLEKNPVDLIVDFNTTALTLIPTPPAVNQYAITSAALGIPYVSCYLDPVTSTMQQVDWASHWQILEQDSQGVGKMRCRQSLLGEGCKTGDRHRFASELDHLVSVERVSHPVVSRVRNEVTQRSTITQFGGVR